MIAFIVIVTGTAFVLGLIIAYNCGYDRGYEEAYFGTDSDLPPITGFDAESHALDKQTFEEEVERRMREMALESETVPEEKVSFWPFTEKEFEDAKQGIVAERRNA